METVLPLMLGLVAGITSYWLALKKELFLSRLEQWQNSKIVDWVFIISLALILFVSIALVMGKFQAFNVWGFDFALFDQVIWNTARGRILENSMKMDAPILLAERFSPILFAFVPLHAVLNDSRLLVVVPPVAMALAAVLLYWFARRRLGRGLALIISLSFLTAPGVQYLALGQFYEIILTIPFLMLASTFLLNRSYFPFLIALALAMLCKEEVGLIAAAFGVYIFTVHQRRILGLVLAVLGIVWVSVLIQVVIPGFQGSKTYYYFGGSITHGAGLYDYLGASVGEIVQNAISRPDVVLQNVFVAEKMDAVIKILLPWGILALGGFDVVLLAMPTFGYTLLSNRRLQYLFGSYHYAPVYIFLFLGLVVGAERLVRWWCARSQHQASVSAVRIAVGAFIFVSSLISYYFHAVGPFSRNFVAPIYTPSVRDEVGAALARTIPPSAIVLAQSELSAHLGQRRYLFQDAVYPCLSGLDYFFADSRRIWYTYRKAHWLEVLKTGWFEIVEQDGYILGKRASALPLERQIHVLFGENLELVGYAFPTPINVVGGQGVRLLTAWRASQKIQDDYTIAVEVYDVQGHQWVVTQQEPCQGLRPTTAWRPGEIHYDDRVLQLPPTMPSGIYRVVVSVHRKDQTELAVFQSNEAITGGVELATLTVSKNKSAFTASELWIEERFFVDMREMRLLGFKPIPLEIETGQALSIGLYWRARSKPQADYLFAVQLRGLDGQVLLEQANRPANGLYPTTEWDAGEVLLDWYDLHLPPTLARQTLHIFVLLKDAHSGRILGEAKIRELRVLD